MPEAHDRKTKNGAAQTYALPRSHLMQGRGGLAPTGSMVPVGDSQQYRSVGHFHRHRDHRQAIMQAQPRQTSAPCLSGTFMPTASPRWRMSMRQYPGHIFRMAWNTMCLKFIIADEVRSSQYICTTSEPLDAWHGEGLTPLEVWSLE